LLAKQWNYTCAILGENPKLSSHSANCVSIALPANYKNTLGVLSDCIAALVIDGKIIEATSAMLTPYGLHERFSFFAPQKKTYISLNQDEVTNVSLAS
jgi:hypothetical protein